MELSQILIALVGGIVGSILTSIISFRISTRNRRQNYYTNLTKFKSEHNWNLLAHNLEPGLNVTQEKLEIDVVCYNHLNLLFYAWNHKDIIVKDGTIKGWKNWIGQIVKTSQIENYRDFSRAYRDIFTNRDLFPREFFDWLEDKMEVNADSFGK